jgi:hypothetical protein
MRIKYLGLIRDFLFDFENGKDSTLVFALLNFG